MLHSIIYMSASMYVSTKFIFTTLAKITTHKTRPNSNFEGRNKKLFLAYKWAKPSRILAIWSSTLLDTQISEPCSSFFFLDQAQLATQLLNSSSAQWRSIMSSSNSNTTQFWYSSSSLRKTYFKYIMDQQIQKSVFLNVYSSRTCSFNKARKQVHNLWTCSLICSVIKRIQTFLQAQQAKDYEIWTRLNCFIKFEIRLVYNWIELRVNRFLAARKSVRLQL